MVLAVGWLIQVSKAGLGLLGRGGFIQAMQATSAAGSHGARVCHSQEANPATHRQSSERRCFESTRRVAAVRATLTRWLAAFQMTLQGRMSTPSIPARLAASRPRSVSSNTTQCSGAIPRRRAASRNGSGSGLCS